MTQESQPGTADGERDDLFRCTLVFGRREELRAFLRQAAWDLIQTSVREEGEGQEGGETYEVTVLLTRRQIDRLEKDGYEPSVGDNMSEIGRRRQAEVAEGDRFDGGDVAPEGLGEKIHGGD